MSPKPSQKVSEYQEETFRWRAYYANGSTVDSTEFAPDKLPSGIVCIVTFLDPPYREIISGGDWYIWDGQKWSSTKTHEEWGKRVEKPEGDVVVKSCGKKPADDIDSIMNEAAGDRQWP